MKAMTEAVWYYFQAVFWCHQCKDQYAVMMRTMSSDYFEATKKVASCKCIRCNSGKGLELQDIHELPIQHLEDYMRWA